jgi:DNA gyrase/topoisomerase IV subunit B
MSTQELQHVVTNLAAEDDIDGFIKYIYENALSKSSFFEIAKFDEIHIRTLLLSYLRMVPLYEPKSEYEVSNGYVDIFLERSPLYKFAKHEWLIELKYSKQTEKKSDTDKKRQTGIEQLKKYKQSKEMQNRKNIKAVLIMFSSKDKYEIIEVQ